jgi:hypothetical protein
MYTVYDKKAQVYSQPFTAINDEVAQRIMQNCVNNPEHNYGLNPEDYSLAQLCTFDDSNAQVEAELKPVLDLITLKRGEPTNEK